MLNRRARHRAIRAEHAAIARKGFKPLAAAFAVVEELAGVGRHRVRRLIAAPRAGDYGVSDHAGNYIAIGKLMRSVVLCYRQHDGEDHPTVFAPVNDALLGFSHLHRYGTNWTGFRRYKRIGLLLHTTYVRAKWLMRI